MNEFKIEHDVEIPGKLGRGVISWVDRLKTMKVVENGRGDSVLLDAKKAHGIRTAALKQGMKITAREQANGMYRIWRLK